MEPLKFRYCWLFLFSFDLSAASLRAIYGDFNSPPAVILQQGKVAAGFMPDIYQLLANELGGDTRDACRSRNPGYDCHLGWVKGEAFK